MHAVIINGSPRVKKLSNTDKIIEKFAAGLTESGSTYELYSISDRHEWDKARGAYQNNDNIIIAIPLYVECVPGLLMEFLETLSPKDEGTKLSFILQSGFAEGIQLRCGEEYLEILTKNLGCTYGGTLVRGNNFMIRFHDEKTREKKTEIYRNTGRIFDRDGNFFSKEAKKFTGPEIYPKLTRAILNKVFNTGARKMFVSTAESLGCTTPLDVKVYPET